MTKPATAKAFPVASPEFSSMVEALLSPIELNMIPRIGGIRRKKVKRLTILRTNPAVAIPFVSAGGGYAVAT
jgi:hypothetical protein